MMNKYMASLNDVKTVNVRSDIAKLLNKISAETICEIGVRQGDHFKTLLIPCITQAIAVDIWKETGTRSQNDDCHPQSELDEQYQMIVDLSIKDTRISIVRDFSVSASQQFTDEYFDFVYIDADHTEAAVYADLCAWWPKVRSGGILAGHDYAACIPTCKDNFILKFGVIEAVNKFVNQNNLFLHTDKESDWFIPKI